MNELIKLIDKIKDFSISDKERKFLYKIINNQQKYPNKSIKKFKNFLNILEGKHIGEVLTSTVEEDNLIDRGIINRIDNSFHPGIRNTSNNNLNNQKCKFTSLGLIYIFNNRYIYSPDFLIKYENDVVLQKLLYQYFQSNTIKNATAKFFNIITEYLSDLSNYLINLSISNHNFVTEALNQEIENNLKVFSFVLGFKILILYNESNLISSNIGAENDKAILAIHRLETRMKKNLSKDIKFLDLLSNISYEFTSSYKDIVNFIK